MRPSDQVTLKIPRALYNRLRGVIKGTGFRSVTEFAVYVLRDLASAHATRPTAGSGTKAAGAAQAPAGSPQPAAPAPEEPLTAAEIEAIRRRLRSLGYL